MFCCQERRHAFEAIQEQDSRRLKIAAYSTFIITFLLIICRSSAYFVSHSLAVKASVLDAIKDCLVSSLNAFFILRSIKPADDSYPFGYGKVEALGAFLQSLFLFITGGFIAFDAIRDATFHEHNVTYSQVAIISLIVSIGLSLLLALIQTHVAKHTKSMAVLADSIHYKSDVVLNIGIVICLFLSFKSAWFDIIIGFCMAVYLIVAAWSVGRRSLLTLLDHSLPLSDRQNIENIIMASGGKIHFLRTHGSGRGEFITIELIEEKETTLVQFQEKQYQIEQKIHQHFPRSFIIISLARFE